HVLSPREQQFLKSTLPLQKDQPLDRQNAVASRERALNVFRDNGYPYAEVVTSENSTGDHKVEFTMAATPGTLAHFGPVTIEGEKSVSEQVIRRELLYKPGDLYRRRDMRNTQRKLYGMELFQFANVESLEDKNVQAPEVETRVVVAEGKPRRLTTGFGYGSEEKARANIRGNPLTSRGGAGQVGVEAKWSSLDRGLKWDFPQPYFMTPHLSLSFEGIGWQAVEPVYSLNTVGGRMMIRHQTTPTSFVAFSFND